jgi:hypothetical protein
MSFTEDADEIRRRMGERRVLQDALELRRLQAEATDGLPEGNSLDAEDAPPDYTDGTWIRVEAAELGEIIEPDGEGRPPIVREVLTGRTLVTYRKRTPEDGDAKVVVASPNFRKQKPPASIPAESYSEWVADVHRRGARPDANVIRQHERRGPTPDSNGRYYPFRCGRPVD